MSVDGSPLTRLPRSFYERDALVVARALLGARLVVTGPNARTPIVTRIVETEAYRGPTDLACHARAGVTKRTRTLYGPPGHAYVYLIYGMYELFNVVTLREGGGHAVLIRAVEPVTGLSPEARTSGPGRLTRALGITRRDDAADLVSGARVFLAERDRRPKIGMSSRIGVDYAGAFAEKPWRFFDVKSTYVSRRA
jgi:DNA-3-methyladenine glycosylase